MDGAMYEKISAWFDSHAEDMVNDIMRLVCIGSVSDPDASEKPFGLECRRCLDEMLKIGEEHGFYTENYEYYVGSIGSKEKNWDNMIGFWNHMDVVPVGNDWDYEPFSPVRKEHFIIGRGAQDNKGPAIGILYMMQCLRELEIPLKHELCLFVGCDEERGMADLEYYTGHYPTPRLSMIADSGFPVCYGEKGIIEGRMVTKEKLPQGLLDCGGGSASNMIPDSAYVVFTYSEELAEELAQRLAEDLQHKSDEKDEVGAWTYEVTEQGIRITAKGTSRHSAFPEGSRNAIYELSRLVSSLNRLEEDVRTLFDNLAYLSAEYYGKNFDMEYSDKVSGNTTCAATILKCADDYLSLHFNIRYAITDQSEKILRKMGECALQHNMIWELERDSAPNYFPKEHPAVDILTNLYNEIAGDKKESFVMGGGTYARKLPRAFAYGIGGMQESKEDKEVKQKIFRPGHGGAHEPDEGLNMRLLLKAMKIYTMGIIALNDCAL